MYRIHFDPKTGQFVVQIQTFGLLWVNVKGMAYATFDEALNRVDEIGLSKLYENRSADRRRAFMAEPRYATS